MNLIEDLSKVNVGDYILFKDSPNERVYLVVEIKEGYISKRKGIYSNDGFSNARMFFKEYNKNFYLLDAKEVNYYLKLTVFEQ